MISFVRRTWLTVLNWWENMLHTLRASIGFKGSEQPHLGLTPRGPRGPNKFRPLSLPLAWDGLQAGWQEVAKCLVTLLVPTKIAGIEYPEGKFCFKLNCRILFHCTIMDCLKTNQNNKKPGCWELCIGQRLPEEPDLLNKVTSVCPYHERSLHCKHAAIASPGGPGKTPQSIDCSAEFLYAAGSMVLCDQSSTRMIHFWSWTTYKTSSYPNHVQKTVLCHRSCIFRIGSCWLFNEYLMYWPTLMLWSLLQQELPRRVSGTASFSTRGVSQHTEALSWCMNCRSYLGESETV